MSYFLEMTEGMTLDEVRLKYAQLVEFNSDMNKELNAVKEKCAKANHKLDAIKTMVCRNRILDVDVTLKAIARVVS